MLQKIKDPYLFQKKVINGVPVYFNNLPWSPCIHILIGFKVGSLKDPIGKEGLAHFLEHMVMNGSPLYPTQKDVWAFRKKYTLDSLNAHTNYWVTEYTAKCLPEHYEKTMEGMLDLILRPILDPNETERERNIIIQEAWDRFRNKKHINYLKNWLRVIRPGIEAGRMINALGWPETIATISRNDLKNWYQNYYHSGNEYVILAGPVKEIHLQYLKKMLAGIPVGKPTAPMKNPAKIGKPLKKEGKFNSEAIGMKQDHATLIIANITKRDVQNDELLNIAGSFLYAVFFEILRQEMGLCYGVHVNFDLEVNFIENEISFNMHPSKIAAAEKKVFEILEEIRVGKYKEKFQEEKQVWIDNLKARERTSSFIISSVSSQLNYFGKIFSLATMIKESEKVTYQDALKYIGNTFKKENVYIEKILP